MFYIHSQIEESYLFLQTLFPGTVSPTRLQIIRKYLARVLLHHNAGHGSRGSDSSYGAGVLGAPVGVLDLDGDGVFDGVFGLELGVALSRGTGTGAVEPGGGEVAHGGVVVVVVLVVVDDGVLGVVGVGVGVGAAGGDALEVVVGGEGAVAGVGGEGGRGKWRRVALRRELALVDGGGGGGGGGVRGGRGLRAPGTEGSRSVRGVRVHFFFLVTISKMEIGVLGFWIWGNQSCVFRWVFQFIGERRGGAS